MKNYEVTRSKELSDLCVQVRSLMASREYDTCSRLICQAMTLFPSAPHPHNLMGVLLEKTGDHASAMKHFRAAWALDPTYGPASQNLSAYGTFYSRGTAAYDEEDCRDESAPCTVEYDRMGIGHILRRK